MPRRGWSTIATPGGWFEVIRGPRPPSVQWPVAAKGTGKGKGKEKPAGSAAEKKGDGKRQSASTSQKKVPSPKGQSKVDRLQAALQALGPEESVVKTALVEAINSAKAEAPKPVHPQQKVAEASARVGRLEAALRLLGEDDPDAEPLKVALKQARMQARVRPVGERLDLCLQYVARVKKQLTRAEDQVREAREAHAQMEEKLANGLRDLEALRAEASAQPRSCPEPVTPRQGMEVDPNEELIRLRAQVAELQERQAGQEADSSRKKARTTELSLTTAITSHGKGGVENPSVVMSSLIEAADSALREAGR